MATPKALVRIDFDEDGDFTDADSDVTSNVRTLKLVQGKVVNKHRAEAAQLEITLKNDDHEYSPPKLGGAFNRRPDPHPNIWFMLGYPVDTFDVANATTLTSRKPDYDDAFAAWEGDTGDFSVLSNKLRTSTGANKSAVLDFGEVDCWVGVQFTRGATGGGLILRWSDASNYLLVRHDGTNVLLSKLQAGTLTTVATSAAVSWDAGDEKWIIVKLHGDDIWISVNNDLVIRTSITFNNTSSKHGVGGRATHADDRWDDFGGWSSQFYGRVDGVQPRPHRNRQYCYMRAFDDMERQNLHQVYRTAPTSPATARQIMDEILDAVEFSSGNRILDIGHIVDRNVSGGTVSATGSSTFQLDDTDQDFTDYTGTRNLVRITDNSGRRVLGFTGASDVDGDGTRVALYTTTALSALGWLESDTGFSVSDTPLTYVVYGNIAVDATHEAAMGRNGYTEMQQVADDDVGLWYVDGLGHVHFEATDHRFSGSHTTDLKQWFASRQSGDETDIYFEDMVWDDGIDRIENDIYYLYHKISLTVLAQVWRLHVDDKPRILSGTRLSFLAIGEGDKIAIDPSLTAPAATTDYTVNSAADGSGTDLTGSVVATLEVGFEGNTRLVQLTNNHDKNGFVTFLQLRALKGVKANPSGARGENATSQTKLGRRRVQHAALHIDEFNVANSRAQARANERSLPKERLVVPMTNLTRANLMQIVHRTISDRIEINYSDMISVARDAFIERKTLEMNEGITLVECEWELIDHKNSLWDWALIGGAYWS